MKRNSGAESEETISTGEDSSPVAKVMKRVEEEMLEDGELREDEASETSIVECDSTRIVIKREKDEYEESVQPSEANDGVQKVVKLEDFQSACRMAQEAQERVHFLENLLAMKSALEKGEESLVDEQQIRISCLTQQLNAERSKAKENELKLKQQLEVEKSQITEERKRVCARMDKLTRVHSEEARKNHDEKMKDRASIRALKEQLEAVEKANANEPPSNDSVLVNVLLMALTKVSAKLEDATKKNGEIIKMDCERVQEIDRLNADIVGLKKTIASLQRKLQLQLQSQNKHMGDLQKKIAETSSELEKAKKEAVIGQYQSKRLDKLEKDYQGVCRIANEYEMGMNEAKARVIELENIIATATTVTPMESTPTTKVAATAVVSPTVADATPATKVQVATVAPAVSAPIVDAEVVEDRNPTEKEETDLDGKKDCSEGQSDVVLSPLKSAES